MFICFKLFRYFPFIILIKKPGEGLPALEWFRKNSSTGYNMLPGEQQRSMIAQISYHEGSRPDEMIRDLALGIVLSI